jgi:hypothetical protein
LCNATQLDFFNRAEQDMFFLKNIDGWRVADVRYFWSGISVTPLPHPGEAQGRQGGGEHFARETLR